MHRNPLIRWHFLATSGELLGTSSGVDGEEVERLLLEVGWRRMQDELVRAIECGGDCVSRQCGKIGEKGVKAMDRQAVRRRAMDLFGDGRGRALRLGDDASSQGFGGRLLSIVVEHRREAWAQMPLDVIGAHAQTGVCIAHQQQNVSSTGCAGLSQLDGHRGRILNHPVPQ
jgi:hypothetical protein